MTDQTTDTLLAELLACERNVWDALVSGDQAADRALLAESFLGVYSDGFSGRSAHVEQLANGPTVSRYELSQAQARWLGADCAMLSYAARFRRIARAGEETMYVTSIWAREGAGWVNIFSQDTPGTAA